jgi:hypothetical protein
MWNTKSPKRSDSGGGSAARLGAPQNAGNTQRELARLERLGHVIVGPDFEACNPAFGGVARRQHQDRH